MQNRRESSVLEIREKHVSTPVYTGHLKLCVPRVNPEFTYWQAKDLRPWKHNNKYKHHKFDVQVAVHRDKFL
jgi:hypothetical protein